MHAPLHGNVSNLTSAFEASALITYSCNAGYELRGVANASCGPAGNWSSPIPECEAASSSATAAPLGVIVGAAVGGVLLIIAVLVIYRACTDRRQVSVPRPNELPVREDWVTLNPVHVSYDQSKLRMSFVYSETDLDQEQDHASRTMSSETDLDQEQDHASRTMSFVSDTDRQLYYSSLKNVDGSPYVFLDDAMTNGNTSFLLAQEFFARSQLTTEAVRAVVPLQLPPRPATGASHGSTTPNMDPSRDYKELNGLQEVYDAGHRTTFRALPPRPVAGTLPETVRPWMNPNGENRYTSLNGLQEVYARTTVPSAAVQKVAQDDTPEYL